VRLLNALPQFGLASDEMAFRLGLDSEDMPGLVARHPHLHQMFDGRESWIATTQALADFETQVLAALRLAHDETPHLPGLPPEALRARMGAKSDPRLFRRLTENMLAVGTLRQTDGVLALAGHRPGLSPSQDAEAARFLDALTAAPFAPPFPELSDHKTILAHLAKTGKICRTPSGIVFAAAAVRRADQILETHLQAHGSISAAEFRDLLGTTRKFSLALLESFDRIGRTIRIGDRRKRGKPPTDPAT
jgi:selenocysteine-specific elongation factor